MSHGLSTALTPSKPLFFTGFRRIRPPRTRCGPTLDLILTISGLVVSAGLTIWMIVLEKKPPPPGELRLVPTTPFLFIGALGIILALAHLVTLLTGTPHVGRFGQGPPAAIHLSGTPAAGLPGTVQKDAPCGPNCSPNRKTTC